jgi:hypothetical protein
VRDIGKSERKWDRRRCEIELAALDNSGVMFN